MSGFSRITSPELTFQWHRSIAEIAAAWDACFGRESVLRSHALHEAVENAALDHVETHYLTGRDGEGVVCVVPCFAFKLSLVAVASPWLQHMTDWIRKVIPGFLTVRLFVVGSAISNGDDLLGFKDLADEGLWSAERLNSVFDEVRRQAKALGIGMVVIKEPGKATADILRARLGPEFFFVESLPAMFLRLPGKESGGYAVAINTHYRGKMKKRKAVCAENGVTWSVVPNSKGREAEIYHLYQEVLERSHSVFERLNQAFFKEVERMLGDDAFYVMGAQQAGGSERLVACELVLCDRDGGTIHPLYSGFDYRFKRDSNVYFNMFYRVIEEAERRGFSRVHLGQTCYEVKAELGAKRVPLYLGIHHGNPWVHWLLWQLRKALFPTTAVPEREVFGVPPPPAKNAAQARRQPAGTAHAVK
ncbi:GNAT family N-acetyltransferase [Prosthecobacter sp.]|uniref:GNAT family N-acetyltransferase n=1 Tax=Prosthecobacter sp. TaxID=1965333 RepID=UPI0037847EEF